MTAARDRRRHSSDRLLLGILAGTVGVALLLAVVWISHRQVGSSALRELPVSWTLNPVWAAAPSPRRQPVQDGPRSLAVYLDVSVPMGGFLASSGDSNELSGFRSLVSQLPDQLFSAAGGTTSPPQWFYVASDVSGPHGNPGPLRRSLFGGHETRLNTALQQIRARLDRGEMETAVLVTDLIATEELIGAMGAAEALSDWMRSDPVRTGEIGVGLLGVRATYWGIYGKCGPDREHGCWFSEQTQKYRPLTQPALKPFYVLVLGRGLGNVERLGHALQDGARDLKLDAQWELLSGSSRPTTFTTSCRAWKAESRGTAEQFALHRRPDGTFECQRGERVELLCPFSAKSITDSAKIETSWPSVQARLRNDQAALEIDCAQLRSKAPAQDLTIAIEEEPQGGWSAAWKGWSAPTDEREEDLGKTLRLESFIERVWLRPDRIRMTSGPILKGHSK